MKVFFISLFAVSVLFIFCYGQQTVDVVYLKNGDVRKGVIIENVANDFIRIESADGSIFTIKYTEIEKITKETKPASQPVSAAPEVRKGLMARNGDFGLTIAFWPSGTISFDDYYYPEHEKDPGVLIRVFYDSYLMEKLAAGFYFNVSPVTLAGFPEGATLYEVGGSIKPRFPLADGSAVVKFGLNIGYRFFSSERDVVEKAQGLGINGSVELQFDAKSVFVPFVELGILSQPVGGTHGETDITFDPLFYFGAGIAF